MSEPTPPVITTTEELAEFCAGMHQVPYITVDTEFLRENTFWPQLCLIQVAMPGDARIIDPLAPDIDLTPLSAVLANHSVLKVFHAARQDVEIFLQLTGTIPEPMFDTQVAAMVLGFGESVSYETLVTRIAKAELDKSSRFTDWSRRPLSERQLRYALADVTHLRVVFEHLSAQLAKTGRSSWLDQEMSVLTDPRTYLVEPDEAWTRLRTRSSNRRFLGLVKALAAWRELEAQSRDLPRGRILKDDAILEIAAHPPKSVDDFKSLRSVPRGVVEGKLGPALMAAVQRGLEMPDEDLPRPEKVDEAPRGVGPLVELLRVLLKMKCEDHDVAQKLVAGSSDLERIAASDNADVPALTGWRREVFGEAALALKHGRLALASDGKRIRVIPVQRSPAPQ